MDEIRILIEKEQEGLSNTTNLHKKIMDTNTTNLYKKILDTNTTDYASFYAIVSWCLLQLNRQ